MQANEIISKHFELLLLTKGKNFSEFIEDENLQKTNFFIYFCEEKEIFILNKRNLYLWFKCFKNHTKYFY